METEEPTDYVLNAETGQLGTVLTQPKPPEPPKPEDQVESEDVL